MADIVLLAIILLMAFWGLKSGFVRALFHFGYYIISAAGAMLLYPHLSKYLYGSGLSAFIHDKVIMPRLAAETGKISLPPFMQKALSEGINNTAQSLADSMTAMTINIICFIIILIVIRFGLRFIVNILDMVARLPLLNLFNKAGGLAIGLLNGFILAYLILAVATIFMNGKLFDFINDSKYAIIMYNNNLLLKLIFG